MRVLVSGWSGSSNLGDELVLAGLLRLLTHHEPMVISIDPPATEQRFGVPAVAPRQIGRLARAAREAELFVLGGGGLLQDETSPFNLPYHLARPALARALRTPMVGVGLGAGPFLRRSSRAMVGQLFYHAIDISVRDEASRVQLATCGVPSNTGADLALCLDAVDATPEDVITVCLRPWAGGGGRMPVAARRSHQLDTDLTDGLAAGLDELAASTGWGVRFVAFQADRDDAVHAAVAARMRTPTERRTPGVHDVLEEVAAGQVVVGMRYHAGIAAIQGARPSVLLGYSPKVEALAGELGTGAVLLPLDARALVGLPAAVERVADQSSAVLAARSALRERLTVDVEVLGKGLRTAARRAGGGR